MQHLYNCKTKLFLLKNYKIKKMLLFLRKYLLIMRNNYFLFIILSYSLSFSQYLPSSPWMKDKRLQGKENSINEINEVFNEYWKTHDKNEKGSGHKPYMRWSNYWQNLTDESGKIISADLFWDAWKQKNELKYARKFKTNFALPTSNWLPVGPFNHTNTGSRSSGQGRVNYVYVDPSNSNTIYIGAPAGGIWKSIDAGINWSPLTDQLPQIGVSGITVDFSNSNVIYIATGDKDGGDTYSVGVYKSTDGGATWSSTGLTGSGNSYIGDLIMHPSNNQILWCATSSGVYKTKDAGATWAKVITGSFEGGNIRLKPSDPTTVYAVSDTNFYKSTDSGDTFTQITSGLPASSSRLVMDVSAAASGNVYVLSSKEKEYTFQGLYKSTDSGNTFTKTASNTDIFETKQSYYDLAIAVSQTNANEIYTGCLNIWKSTNGGTSFTKLNYWDRPSSANYTHADIHYLQFYGTKLYAGTDGGVYVSANNGTAFTDLTAGLQISQFYKIAVSKQSADKMMGGLQDNGGYAYSNSSWKTYFGADGMDTGIDPNNSNKYYGFIQNGSSLYITNNAGEALTTTVDSPNAIDGNWVTPLAINTSGEVYSGFIDLYKLNGSEWVKQNTNSVGTTNIEVITIDPNNNNIIYIGNDKELYKSIDRGITFAKTYTASANITSICVNESNSTIVYITTSGSSGLVLKSIDSGASFTSFSTGLPNIGKNVIKHQARSSLNPLFLGTSLGVYYRDDSMSSWQAFDTNLPNVSVTDLEINLKDAKLTAATYGRGIWQTSIPVDTNPQNDVELVSFTNGLNQINCGSTIPQINVKNNGANLISTISFDYQINGATQNYIWNGSILSGASTVINLPSISINKGAYILNVKATIANDAFADNNQLNQIFYFNDAGTVAVVNTFETAANELLTYTDGFTSGQWKRGLVTTASLATGTNNVYATNFSGTYPNGTKAYLVSQCFNLSKVTNPTLKFKMAFDLERFYDIAYVEYTTDNGLTWKTLGVAGATWYNSSRTPNTSGSDCYNCIGAQWTGTSTTLKQYSYPLNTLGSPQNAVFRIVFYSDELTEQAGVVVDDFVIDGTLDNEVFKLENVAIYPNPSEGVFNISLGNIVPTSVSVLDITGKIILSKNNFTTNDEISLDLTNVTSGVYFVKIATENENIIKKIIKE